MAGSMSVEASDWRDRLVSADVAVSVVRPGDKVFVGSACATPRSVVEALERLGRPGWSWSISSPTVSASATRPARDTVTGSSTSGVTSAL
jgi:hypothetical protein